MDYARNPKCSLSLVVGSHGAVGSVSENLVCSSHGDRRRVLWFRDGRDLMRAGLSDFHASTVDFIADQHGVDVRADRLRNFIGLAGCGAAED